MKWENFWEAAERRESVCEGSSGLGLEGEVCVAGEGISGDEGDEVGEDEVWADSEGSLASSELAFLSEEGGCWFVEYRRSRLWSLHPVCRDSSSCPREELLVVMVVRPRMDEVADIDRDSGADGPLSCLRRKVDPGRNKGRAAATGPVIANGIVEAAAEAGVEGGGRQAESCNGTSCLRARHFFNATSGHLPDRQGSLSYRAAGPPVVGPNHVSSPVDRGSWVN